MVDASLVNEIWPDVGSLLTLTAQHEPRPSVEAVFVAEDGDWRILVVVPNVEETGPRPIYAALDEDADRAGVDVSLIARIVVLDAADPDAQSLSYGQVQADMPPRRWDLTIPSLPGFTGAVVRRDRWFDWRHLENEVMAALLDEGLPFTSEFKVDSGLRVDFVLRFPDGREVLIDVKLTDRRNIRNQLLEAAGHANIAGLPLVLILATRDRRQLSLNETYGNVPVLPVDWVHDGIEGFRAALARSLEWRSS